MESDGERESEGEGERGGECGGEEEESRDMGECGCVKCESIVGEDGRERGRV